MNREAMAAEIGRRQKISSLRTLSKPVAKKPASQQAKPQYKPSWLLILETFIRMQQAPFSLRKAWFYACSILWFIFEVGAFSYGILPGILLTPFYLVILWLTVNTPIWFFNGISPKSHRSSSGAV